MNDKLKHGEIGGIKHIVPCDLCGAYHGQSCVECMAASHRAGKAVYCERCQKASDEDGPQWIAQS
jgi:hypothetical protein